jgi:TspO/MBR family
VALESAIQQDRSMALVLTEETKTDRLERIASDLITELGLDITDQHFQGFIAMAIEVRLVWRKVGLTTAPMQLFLLQLLLNVAWSALFFRLRSPGLAFAEIVMLWFAILAASIGFWRAVPAAGWLLLPYLIWVSNATALNFSIWRLNA